MTRSLRPSRSREFRGRHLESLELRGLLSNLPTIPTTMPDGPSVPSQVSTQGDLTGGSIAYGEAVPSDGQITTLPADSSNSSTSPSQLVIMFNQPISSFDLTGQDIRLDRINGDGTTTPVYDFSNWPQEIADNDGGFDLFFTQITIPLDSPLPDGNYQIVLVGSIISSDIADGDWDPFSEHVISTFSVGESQTGGGSGESQQDPVVVAYSNLNPGANVQSLQDLGTLPTTSPITPGLLSPTPGQTSVVLYRFSIADGHHWRLGIEANPRDSSGGFQTSLSLYRIKADGSLEQVPLGDPGAGISDPGIGDFTYLGIDPGMYCLSVSGTFNTPEANASGGSFQLTLDATPADQATQVTGFQLNWANSFDDSPAGLTIRFSGPIALNGFSEANQSTPPLEVVDSNGKVWGVIPFNYADDGNALTLVFGDRLPAGTYSLRIGAVKGLTDLAGWNPVAPGLSSGILATWTVGARQTPAPQSYLGVVWPNSTTGIGGSGALAEGFQDSSHFAVIAPGFYKLLAVVGQGTAEVRILSSDGHVVLDEMTAFSVNFFQAKLPVGIYTLQWIGMSSPAVRFTWTLSQSKIDWESLLNNGVGQWTAVNFGFAAPGNSPPAGPSQSPPSSQTPVTPDGLSTADSPAHQPQILPGTVTLSQPLLLAPLTFSPIGMPSAQTQAVATVGPAVEPGAISVADSTVGLMPGIRYGRADDAISRGDVEDVLIDESSNTPAESAKAPATAATESGRADDSAQGREERTNEADRNALASADWILGIGRFIENWLDSSIDAHELPNEPRGGGAVAPLIADLEIGEQRPWSADKERASFDFPLGVLVVSAIAYRAKDPVRRWWKKHRHNPMKAGDPRHQHRGEAMGPERNQANLFGHGPHFRKRPNQVEVPHQSHRGVELRGRN